MKYLHIVLCIFLFSRVAAQQQASVSLKECFSLAHQNNTSIKQAGASLKARQYNLEAERQSYLPKIDLLANYNYLSKPLEINLETVRGGVIEGTSQQNVQLASSVIKEVTGSEPSQAFKDAVYGTSKTIIGTFYPSYNPPLSQQQYFTSSLGVRQPLYLGGKLNTARKLAEAELNSGKVNVSVVSEELDFAIALQYMRILFLNSLLRNQQQVVSAAEKNLGYAESLVKNEILPPYQKNWMKVALLQSKTTQQNLQIDKKNAMLELYKLLGISNDTIIVVNDTLPYGGNYAVAGPAEGFYKNNAGFRFLESKTAYAQTSVRVSKSLALPNVFAIGNINLYQKDLPVTVPPWLLGVEMVWNIFNGTQTQKRIKASKELVEEARLAEENTRQVLSVQAQVVMNKLEGLQQQAATLDSARTDARITTRMVEQRMENILSSPKDVNEATLAEAEIDKLYYTSVLGYYLALAEYFHVTGETQKIVELIDN
ncbi:TolC family protein [Danxiaibacter flavus]|uniref:TolC family protein n=1 Tax=Danxiaibacter flavus TaxID=3049108 RepID=A0ABV3Z8S4_9BACT|nr:TolC family protein [Chitinophagaceae bacterium DXS]